MTLPNHLTHDPASGIRADWWYQQDGQPTVYVTADHAARMEARSAPAPDPFEGYNKQVSIVPATPVAGRVVSRAMRTLQTCHGCGETYYPTSPTQKFCTPACKDATRHRDGARKRKDRAA